MKRVIFIILLLVLTFSFVCCTQEKETCNHEIVIDEYIAPTCVSTGKAKGAHCSKCGIVFIEQELIECSSHYKSNKRGYAPTLEASGLTNGIYCQNCGIVIEEQKITYLDKDTGLVYFVNNDGKSCSICGFIDNSNSLIIPNVINGLLVTEIYDSAFYGCNSMVTVTLPEGLVKIGVSAFSQCSALENITIPLGLKIIDSKAFQGCSNLKEIVFDEKLETIGSLAFSGCSSIDEIFITKNVKLIGCSDLNDNPYNPFDSNMRITLDADNEYFLLVDDCLIEKSTMSLIKCSNECIIPNGVKHICRGSVMGVSKNVDAFVIPEGVIEVSAASIEFNSIGCLILPKTLEHIDESNLVFIGNDGSYIKYGGTKEQFDKLVPVDYMLARYFFERAECSDGVLDWFNVRSFIKELQQNRGDSNE